MQHVPFMCPQGHRLSPGRVIVGWSPCGCPPCIVGSGSGGEPGRGLRGHRTYLCLTCKDEHMTTMCYQPYHIPDRGTDYRWP